MSKLRGGSRIFLRRGCTRLLLYFNTNKPHSFFLQNTSCIRNRRSSQEGGGGAHLLHPPPRSAPETSIKAGAPENKTRDFMIEESCTLYHEKVFYNKFNQCYSLNHDDIN